MPTLLSPRATLFLAAVLVAPLAFAVAPTPDELATARQWVAARFDPAATPAPGPPFAFRYDGRPSPGFLLTWPLKQDSRDLDQNRTERTLTWTDPKTSLQVRCVAVEYHDFPTVEWTLYFKNTGTNPTPILQDIDALNLNLERGTNGEFLLHHNVGSPANGSDYGPLQTPLGPKAIKRIGAAGGRPTNSDWSYFNLEWPGQGLILAVGWPGQWAAEFSRNNGRGLLVHAGQELAHFKLLPGEEVRGPLIVLQFWKGDWIRAQNIWRHWMMAHSMPRPGGKLPPPQLVASSSRQYEEMIKANETNQCMFIDRYLEEGIKLDYWWMDAGWYNHHGGGWPRVGTWEVDTNRFPRGLRAVSDYAHQKGMRILVWFEPERVTPDTWITRTHPEWVLGGAKGGLLNLGNDEARAWLTDHVDRLLTEQGIDLYRQDFNMDPLAAWRANDAPDRQGTTEIKHVTGYLAYWDELRRRHTSTYGHPVPTPVRVEPVKGKAILISGHDLKDLEKLLQQTESKGINVYTHGEMLPAHGYPRLKKYPHLVGNYGGAWQDQRDEFHAFPGAILMTTNCLQEPQEGYKHRIFTAGHVGWPGIPHIANGDFTPVIQSALAAPGFSEDGPDKTILVGFGHNAVLSVADKVIEAVKAGAIKHFFLVGGCDGARAGRNYYTEFAEALPKDCVILTLACGKYRFNKLDFGTIGGIPRLLDIGQCNDAYAAIQIAVALSKAFNCGVNDLPLSLVLSWYEQKAVAILLTLLHLGIRNIRLGPTLPAFVTPAVLNVLVERFNLMPIKDAQSDIAAILNKPA